jgi:hypothetical protein
MSLTPEIGRAEQGIIKGYKKTQDEPVERE